MYVQYVYYILTMYVIIYPLPLHDHENMLRMFICCTVIHDYDIKKTIIQQLPFLTNIIFSVFGVTISSV